jgi:hypothetical protein
MLVLASSVTACAQVSFVSEGRSIMKVEATRSTYACPCCSKNSRNCVQLPYTSSPQAKSNTRPSANASAQTSMANWPLVRNSTSGGSPIPAEVTGSVMCSAGIH